MSTPILATKLYIPPPRTNVVLRARLIERLNDGLHRKLTLVSAPAGFGKTTLVCEWVEKVGRPAAWLSLDAGDNDLNRFLTYFVSALRTITPHMGDAVLAALQSPQPPPAEMLLTAMLNDMSAMPEDFLLVLDDYHVIDAAPVDHALTFVIEHLPPRMHLVITARDDPQLPVARLRGRGQLTELRANDLRFNPAEAAEFLNRGMGLSLSAENIAALEDRTEGWIAGLQLAALSLQGHEDVPEFIRAFAGDHRYIVDYLVEEVLERQPDSVRHFLLQTAILDRMNGPLCDAVTGQEEGSARLEALERGNFFVVPLDDKRHWYRYHHLFADVLAAHLKAEQPDQVAVLHLRACAWYERHGSSADAIRHALAAKDFARAADLIELAVPAARRNRQEAAVLGWLKAIPAEVLRTRPVLTVHFAGTLLQSNELEGVEARLQDAERWLQPDAAQAEMVVVDTDEFQHLAGSIAMYRAGIALISGDPANTIKYGHQALDLDPDYEILRGSVVALLGLAYWTQGDLEAAHRSYTDGMARLQKAGYIADFIGGAVTVADIRKTQGRLRDAMSTYERGLQLATEHRATVLRGAADMHVGLSTVFRERNDLKAATAHLQQSEDLGEFAGLPQNRHRWRVAAARIREAEGDLDGALDLLNEAERVYTSDFSPNVRPIAALKARVWLAQGRLGDAFGWAREQNLSVEDDLSYLREFEHITLARILLAQHMLDGSARALNEAVGLLERLLHFAEQGERTGNVIEILVVLALVRQMQGSIAAALAPLERALTLAEPEGYVRMFVDEGRPMAGLLEKAAKQGIAPNYVRRLLGAFGRTADKAPVRQDLIEPLSERELEVLRLLGSDLDGPELARTLMVSLNTVRTHTKNIYSKLGVNSRRAAVRRAEELGLL